MRVFLLATALLGAAWAPDAARASSCNNEVVVNIAIAPGRSCWIYRGHATTFVGDFGGGQHIEARMKGEESEIDPQSGRIVTHIADRMPDASGPGGFFTSGEGGFLGFYAPRGGIYRFGFSPCAMWGGEGTVEICAR